MTQIGDPTDTTVTVEVGAPTTLGLLLVAKWNQRL